MEGMINKLFEGHTLNYLECINVDYQSSRKESFMDVQASTSTLTGSVAGLHLGTAAPGRLLRPPMVHESMRMGGCLPLVVAARCRPSAPLSRAPAARDLLRPLLQLDVKGCKDIYASFDKYCEVEVLEGDNQYNAEKHGMQVQLVWDAHAECASYGGLQHGSGGGSAAMRCPFLPCSVVYRLGAQEGKHAQASMPALASCFCRHLWPRPRTPPPGRARPRSAPVPLQDARKGILFESFPPVLQLQLKRFEYDFMKDMMVKVRWGCAGSFWQRNDDSAASPRLDRINRLQAVNRMLSTIRGPDGHDGAAAPSLHPRHGWPRGIPQARQLAQGGGTVWKAPALPTLPLTSQINDRYEFHDTIDLDRDDGKYLSSAADRNVHNKYKLLAVLVHSGGVHGGHYYAYVRCDRMRHQHLQAVRRSGHSSSGAAPGRDATQDLLLLASYE